MGHMRFGVTSAAALAFIFLGCESEQTTTPSRPIESDEATVKVNQRVDAVLTGLSEATAVIDTTDSTKVATDGMNGALGNSCGNSGSTNLADGTTDTVDSIPQETTNKLSDVLGRIGDEAKEHIFREELVESTDGNQVVYKMDPAQTCEGGDSECIAKLTKNPLRFAVTANGDDSLNVALLVGEERHSPATAVLSDNKISLRGNLAEAMDAIRLFVPTQDQDDLPEKLVGSVEWSIEKRGEGDFAFTSSILERFELRVGQATGKPISVTVQPSNPTSQITINSVTNTVGFKQNLGAVDVSVAGSAMCEDTECGQKEQAGTFYFHLGGFTGEVQTSAGASELTFSGLGMGNDTSYAALNQERLATMDLNPNNNRKFSMNFKKTDGGTLVTFEPALDLHIGMAMSKLSESMRVDMPDWLADEVFDVTLGGAAKPSILIPSASCNPDGTSSTKEQLKVVTGSLTLDATSIANPIEVASNMCLVPSETEAADGAHPFSLLSAGTCQ